MFRDSQVWYGRPINQVNSYFHRMTHQTYGFNKLSILALEGNSTDNTLEVLRMFEQEYPNVKVFTEQNEYLQVSSIENQERFKGLSKVADFLLRQALEIEELDYVLWIESDLIFDISLVSNLVFAANHYTERNCIIAPMIQLKGHDIFYDTWGFRELDGTRWTQQHKERVALVNPLKEMSSIGSCALIDADLLRCGVRFGQGAFVELCERARKIGGKVYVDVNTKIFHPGEANIYNRWI